tara:strand:- start:560 stop:853 length:294 start_codon:yes stop_codon:yes gene_type:complete
MDLDKVYDLDWVNTIISEPIYLSIVVIFILISIYSILKKFFKLLIIILSALILYIGFLIYTGEDLPGESEEIINPIIDQAGELIKNASEHLQNLSTE